MSDEVYIKMLEAKLDEEFAEYHKEQSFEELADLIEGIYAIVRARGISLEELERIRIDKAEKSGVFANRVLLKSVAETSIL